MRWITIENRAGDPVPAGARRLTPISGVVRVEIPGWPGGLVWNRPVAMLVRGADGQETVLPVRDVTRIAQVLVLAAGLLGSWLIWLAFRHRKAK